jgi:hemoglobin
MTDYERLGGEQALQSLVRTFVSRMAGDFVIGFRFIGKDLDRIAFHEAELAAAHLGGPQAYHGRSLSAVHQPMRLNRGQFDRRLAILATVLREHQVPEDILERWIAHDRALLPAIATTEDCVS